MAACGHPVRDVDKYATGESSMQIYANFLKMMMTKFEHVVILAHTVEFAPGSQKQIWLKKVNKALYRAKFEKLFQGK